MRDINTFNRVFNKNGAIQHFHLLKTLFKSLLKTHSELFFNINKENYYQYFRKSL